VKHQTNNPWLKVVPLGGLGHIGGNLMVYETADDLVMVDCGVLFPTVAEPGINYIVPDISYVIERRDKLRGILLTHGHEDHIGALPFLLPMLGHTTLYATAFTAALIRNKMTEHPDVQFTMEILHDRQKVDVGELVIDPLAVTHSIPQAVAFAMGTPIGTVVHTGDFKIDDDPLDGRLTDLEGLAAYGEEGVALLCSDSTNSQKPGRTWSEREVQTTLRTIIGAAEHRVFITTFASHIDRIQAICDAAMHADRKVLPLGRSMKNNIAMAMEMGVLRAPASILLPMDQYAATPRNKIIVLASGSQGEPFSSMTRIAQNRMPPVNIDPDDAVIFSSRKIPGNELAIGNMINQLIRMGARIIGDHEARVHSSGHAFNDEQRQMIALCKPRAFVPLHGELRHMVAHAALAKETGVAPERVFVLEDGQPLQIDGAAGDAQTLRRIEKVASGLLFVDGKGIGDVGEIVLRDRRFLSEAGIVAAVVVLSSHADVVLGPEIVTRGLVYVDENQELLARAADAVRRALEADRPIEMDGYRETIRFTLRRFFKRELGRKPMVVPVVLRLPDHCCD
jgi:ribonuclease J